MNGRIYDPTLGRFLQADPHIQAPENSQSYNRYSYVLNNPLSYTDPSGYFFKKLWKGVKKFATAIAAIAITAACQGACAPWVIGALSGGIGAAVNGGNILKGALIGAFTAHAFSQIGEHFNGLGDSNLGNLTDAIGTSDFDSILNGLHEFGGNLLTSGQIAAQIASHAITGGIVSTLTGGKFGHGFFSAGVTKGIGGKVLASGRNLSSAEVAKNTAYSAVIGGTASVVSGGKFANGARTSTFQYLFNQVGPWLAQKLLIKHYSRNMHNDTSVRSIEDLPEGTIELSPGKSIYHQFNVPEDSAINRKFVGPEGLNEWVFTADGTLVESPESMGTYNYFSPNGLDGVLHIGADVVPYFFLGNTPTDTTTFWERFSCSWSCRTE